MEALTPAGQYRPRPQATCVAGVAQMEPAAHGIATVVPAWQYCPALQATCVDGVAHT